MTLPVFGEQTNGNHFVAFQSHLSNNTTSPFTNHVNVTTTPLAMYVYFTLSAVGSLAWTAPFSGTLWALTGSVFLSTGTTANTISYSLQKSSMISAVSGVGSTYGAFSAVSGVVTNSATPTTTPKSLIWTSSVNSPISFNAGTIFQIYATASASTSNVCGSASLIVSSYF